MSRALPASGVTEVPLPCFLDTLFRHPLTPTALIAPFDHEQIGFAPAPPRVLIPLFFARSARVVALSGRQG